MFTVFSKPACPWCDQAKALLSGKGLSYNEIILDYGQEKDNTKKYMSREEFMRTYPGQRTLPLILKNENRLGGFTELKNIL